MSRGEAGPCAAKHFRPFGEPPLSLNDAFHLEVDWATDRVFLASSSRHRIQVFAPQGPRLAQQERGLCFPNQLVFREGSLYVANTNRLQTLFGNSRMW